MDKRRQHSWGKSSKRCGKEPKEDPKKRKEKASGNAWSAVVPDLSFVPILHPHVIKTTGKTTLPFSSDFSLSLSFLAFWSDPPFDPCPHPYVIKTSKTSLPFALQRNTIFTDFHTAQAFGLFGWTLLQFSIHVSSKQQAKLPWQRNSFLRNILTFLVSIHHDGAPRKHTFCSHPPPTCHQKNRQNSTDQQKLLHLSSSSL